jgi:hypothetical protein
MIISISALIVVVKTADFHGQRTAKNLDFDERSTIFEFYQYTFVYKEVVLIFAVLLEE